MRKACHVCCWGALAIIARVCVPEYGALPQKEKNKEGGITPL